MRYYLVQEQPGGCDYTIGCGISITCLNAKNMDSAMKEIMEGEEPVLITTEGEGRIKSARILEVSNIKEIDLEGIKRGIRDKKAVEARKLQDEQELKEFERLKKKFKG